MLATVDGRQRDRAGLTAGPVEHSARVVLDQVSRSVDGLIQAQLRAAQVGQRLTHDLDRAQVAQGGQPALAGIGGVLGEDQGQVYAAKLRQRAAPAGITERQAGAAEKGLIKGHGDAICQGLGDAGLHFQEHLT